MYWSDGLHQATDDMASCLFGVRTRCTGLMAYTRLQMTWPSCLFGVRTRCTGLMASAKLEGTSRLAYLRVGQGALVMGGGGGGGCLCVCVRMHAHVLVSSFRDHT